MLMAVALDVNAQGVTVTVKGQVVDAATNEPLIGVTVRERDSKNAAITDLDGNYALQVKSGSYVDFSYVSYQPRAYKTNAVPRVVRLEQDSKSIDEVVVVGFGTQKKVNRS